MASFYKARTPVETLMENIAIAFEEEGYTINRKMMGMLNEHFVWERSTDVTSLDTVTSTSSNNIKYVLCAKTQVEDLGARYAEGRVRLLSIRPSLIPGAGLGVFAEKTFRPNERITVYLGDSCQSNPDDDHEKSPYKLWINSNISIDVNKEPQVLLLGAHLINEIEYFKQKRGIGRPPMNNCKFEKFEIIAKRKIIIGNELHLDYGIKEKT